MADDDNTVHDSDAQAGSSADTRETDALAREDDAGVAESEVMAAESEAAGGADEPLPRNDDSVSGGRSPMQAHLASEQRDEKPELLVGAAFAGGLIFAQVLKLFGGDDD